MSSTLTADAPSLPGAVHSVIQRVCERYPVAKMEVFGSKSTEIAGLGGDVDLLVEFLPDSHPGLLEMGALREDLEQQLGCRVDLLSRRAVERSQNIYRRRTILSNPTTIYAR